MRGKIKKGRPFPLTWQSCVLLSSPSPTADIWDWRGSDSTVLRSVMPEYQAICSNTEHDLHCCLGIPTYIYLLEMDFREASHRSTTSMTLISRNSIMTSSDKDPIKCDKASPPRRSSVNVLQLPQSHYLIPLTTIPHSPHKSYKSPHPKTQNK